MKLPRKQRHFAFSIVHYPFSINLNKSPFIVGMNHRVSLDAGAFFVLSFKGGGMRVHYLDYSEQIQHRTGDFPLA